MEELKAASLKTATIQFEPIDAETWIDVESVSDSPVERKVCCGCKQCGYIAITAVTTVCLALLCTYTWFCTGGPSVGTIDEWSSVLERKLEGSSEAVTTIEGQ